MEHLPKKIHQNGISYTLVGDYYIPDLKLPEESRPIGRWGRMHKAFLQEHRPGQYNALLLSGKIWTYLADLNEQAADRLACIVSQMQEAEGLGTGCFRQRTARQRRWICGTERGRMPPVGASEGVDRLKTAVCCRVGCHLVAGFVSGDFPVWIREKPVNKDILIYLYLRQRKQRDFSRKFKK